MSLVSNVELVSHPSAQFEVVKALQTLIRFKSVTPAQAGAIDWLEDKLSQLGFECEVFSFNHVTNLIAKVTFGDGPVVAFSGHIDVVPAAQGDWRVDPFSGEIVEGNIYGRGAADMKAYVQATPATYLRSPSAKAPHIEFDQSWTISTFDSVWASTGSS